MSVFHLDYETRSRQKLGGKGSVGSFRYANDPSCAILCAAIAKGDEEPRIWAYGSDPRKSSAYEWLREAVEMEDSIIYAHNAMFEISVSMVLFQKTFGLRPPANHQWRCTMAMARRAGLPASLEKCAEALNLINQKDKRGSSLIAKFSVPQPKDNKKAGKLKGDFIEPHEDPSAFRDFCDYCLQDVRVEREIHKKLKDFELKGFPLRTYQLDIDINTRGIPVNLAALRNADAIIEEETIALEKRFQRLTGFNPTQVGRVLQWLQDNGFEGDNLKKDTMEEFFENATFDPDTLLGKALNLRKQASFASLKKVKPMIACAGSYDNRVRGTLNYHGAGTGRWTASLIQPQNFKKPSKHLEKVTESIYRDILEGASGADLSLVYGPPLECISSAIRHFIHDADGPFLDADYTAIEARIIAWQAQEKWRLDFFKGDSRIYEASAQQMFGTTMKEFETYKKLNGTHHPHRQKGKVAELALGYQGGKGAMLRMGALKEGLKEDELPGLVKTWRSANPSIVQLWYDIENAAKASLRTPGSSHAFGVGCEMFCAFTAGIKYLFMRLPSGRKIAYPLPALEKQIRWTTINRNTGEEVRHVILNPTVEDVQKAKQKDPEARIGEALTYWGEIKTNVWGRISAYGGSLTNNCVQGIAADVMAVGAHNAWKAGYEIVSLIHDEALAHAKPGQTIEEFVSLLTDMPAWADGLPLDAAGEEIPFYKKG